MHMWQWRFTSVYNGAIACLCTGALVTELVRGGWGWVAIFAPLAIANGLIAAVAVRRVLFG